jgi:integrase
MRKLCALAGVPYFRYHALRHCGASLLESNNIPIGTIQRILGHENRITTELYLHSIGQAERVAIATLENSNGNSHTSLTQKRE